MKSKYSRLIIGLLFFLNFFTVNILAEENTPPWIKGNYPKKVTNAYYKVIKTNGALSNAKKQAINMLVLDISTQKGVKISSQAINEIVSEATSTENGISRYNEKETNKQITNIKRDEFDASFSLVDEFYQYSENGTDYYALFIISSNDKPLKYIPTLSYKLDKGSWRSIIVPGWAQFYQKRYVMGLTMLGGEVALLSTSLYFNNRISYNKMRMNEANNIKTKQFYKKKMDNFTNYRNIFIGLSGALYLYNVIDAFTSKKGVLKYTSKSGRTYSVRPTLQPNPITGSDLALKCSITL